MGEGGSVGPLYSALDTIHPIDLIFDTYNELSLHFYLNKATWCLIGLYDNYDHMNNVTCSRDLGFSNFQIF